jgi:hypothetical protein
MLTATSLCISLYVENTASTINIRYETIKILENSMLLAYL